MIPNEARAILKQASQLEKSNPDDKKTQRDVVGLLLVAIDKAGGSFPEAEAELAWMYFKLRDEFKAIKYADRALASDPNLFIAQYVKLVYVAVKLPGFFAELKFKNERKKLLQIFENLCKKGISSKDFVSYANVLMEINDESFSKSAFSAKYIYETIASVPIDKVVYESDSDKTEVEQVRLIAQGRSKI